MTQLGGLLCYGLLEAQSFSVQAIAAHIEHPVITRTIILQGSGRGKLNQLFFGKMLAQFGIELLAYVRRSVCHGICHAQQRGLGRHKAFDVSIADCFDFFIA